MSSKNLRRAVLVLVALLLLGLGGAGAWYYQRFKQQADPRFDTRVANPAYSGNGPRVLLDEAHRNFHTAGGRYKPFVDLVTSDGYRVTPNRRPFRAEALAPFDILVIANALGAPWPFVPWASRPAFTEAECDAVRDWVRAGGALLLIADHEPAGAAAQLLSSRFGVHMSEGRAFDETNHDPVGGPSWLLFSSENQLLGDHPIVFGRNAAEGVHRVIAFTGQSLKGPDGSVAFLRLSEAAFDVRPSGERLSGQGRAVGVALPYGRGRVVVLAEAAMLTAQLVGRAELPLGMNYPNNNNRQLALNVMHWLSEEGIVAR